MSTLLSSLFLLLLVCLVSNVYARSCELIRAYCTNVVDMPGFHYADVIIEKVSQFKA
jgi:GTP-binding protein EngB required for normal cell division